MTINNIENKESLTDIKDKYISEIKKLFIDPEQNFDKNEIKELYKNMYTKLEIIKDIISATNTENKENILGNIENMQSNIKFINEINNNNYYLQIPLMILDKERTGELYILKNDKSRKRIDPEDAKMLISLDTENIGQVDSLINIKKHNISVNMILDNKEVVNFVKKNQKILYESLIDKEYKLVDFKCRVREKEINLMNAKDSIEEEFEKNLKNKIDYRL